MRIDQVYSTYLYEGLTFNETKFVRTWERAGQLISEAQLTPDQIQQLFTSVEQGATAAGGNRTMIGKGKDAAGAVKKAYDDLVSKVQNSGPVKGVDAMYNQAAEKLKQATGGDQGVMQYVQKYRDFAKAHPIAQSLIYSALIAAAGISGVGVGGAAALGLFKMVDKLLQGEKFSTAVGKGIATGATAYAAGQIGQALKGTPQQELPGAQGAPGSFQHGSGIGATGDTAGQAAASAVGDVNPRSVAKGAMEIFKQKVASGEVTDYNSYQDAMQDAVAQASKAGAKTASRQSQMIAQKMLDAQLNGVVAQASGGNFVGSGPEKVGALIKALGGTVDQDSLDRAASAVKSMAAANARSAASQATSNATFESKKLSESQIFLLIGKIVERQRKLDEGIMDTLKGAAGKAVDWAKTKGTNLTTKITADKLLQAWKKAGSPTDSKEIKSFLSTQGLDAGVIDSSMISIGVTGSTPAAPAKSAATPASTPSNVAAVAGGAEGIKKWYQSASPEDRQAFKNELEIIDDQDRLASGTNESVGFSRFLGMAI